MRLLCDSSDWLKVCANREEKSFGPGKSSERLSLGAEVEIVDGQALVICRFPG